MVFDRCVLAQTTCEISTKKDFDPLAATSFNSYVRATVPVVQSGTTNVVPLLLRTASDDRNKIFCASEQEFPEFPEFWSGITNLVSIHRPHIPGVCLLYVSPCLVCIYIVRDHLCIKVLACCTITATCLCQDYSSINMYYESQDMAMYPPYNTGTIKLHIYARLWHRGVAKKCALLFVVCTNRGMGGWFHRFV